MSSSGDGKSMFFGQWMEAVAGAGQPVLVVDPTGDSVSIDRIEGEGVELLYYGPKSGAPDLDIIGEGGPNSANDSEPFGGQ